MTKRLLLAVCVFSAIACSVEPARPLQVGDRLDKAYFRDLNTGKCVSVDGVGKFQPIYVEDESFCKSEAR